jgi:hypothetical protein
MEIWILDFGLVSQSCNDFVNLKSTKCQPPGILQTQIRARALYSKWKAQNKVLEMDELLSAVAKVDVPS